MKKTLLFASLFAAGSLMAQDAFTNANEMEYGTTTYFVCDSLADNMAGISGTGVTWDYSDLAKYDGVTKSLMMDVASATSYGADFPEADNSSWLEELTNDYWSSDADARYRFGIVISEPSFGDVVAAFDDTVTVFPYPFAMNDVATSTFAGQAGTQMGDMPFTGTHKAVYDGYGTLKVGDQIIENVSRIHYTDLLTITSPFGELDVTLEQFEYYDLANGNEPIFIHSSGDVAIAGSFSVVISKIEPTSTVSVNNVSNVNFTVSPNPVKDELFLNGEFDNASVQIVNQAGQVVYNGVASNGTMISTADFEAGIYVVKATVNNQVVTTKVVKF